MACGLMPETSCEIAAAVGTSSRVGETPAGGTGGASPLAADEFGPPVTGSVCRDPGRAGEFGPCRRRHPRPAVVLLATKLDKPTANAEVSRLGLPGDD